MSILDALNRVGLSSRPASVIPAQQPVEGPRMPVQPFSQPAKISGPSESYQALGESEKAELLKAIGMDGQQVEQPKPEPATAAVGSTELTLDASEPEAGPNSGGEAVTESKADSGQVEEKPDPKPASSDPLKNARKKRKDSGSETVPNRDVGNAKSIDEIITSGSTSRVLRKYLDENGGSPEDYKVVEEMEARESEAREAMPAMVLVGPKGIFKSGCKELIIRPILGGRNAEPLKNMKGNQFNSGIAGGESWEFDDISSTPDSKERKLFGDGLKRYTSTTEINVESKFNNSFQSPPLFYRVSMYLNDENQDLWALPQMTKSLKGKVIALETYGPENRKVKLPTTNAERQAFRKTIIEELPAFVYWLVNEFEIPKELQDSGYGIAGWIHPEIEEKLNASSDEARLQRLVDVVIFDRQNLTRPWEGKHSDMETDLLVAARDLHRETELRKILWYDGAFFDLLKKIKAMPDSRVSRKHTRDGNIWVWAPPLKGRTTDGRGKVRVDVDFTGWAAHPWR